MIHDFRFPLQILPDQLDNYLAAGWYRMSQCIFTTDYVEVDGHDYQAIWLRIDLNSYKPSSTFEKLEKRNRNFRVEIVPFVYSRQHELLYAKYVRSVTGERSKTLADFLFDFTNNDIFNSVAIHLYDVDKLIAVGIFDIGRKSVAGICSFFDPDYKKHSLGRYLIYKKIEYCCQNGFDYFYPGYFVPGIETFDYKLRIGTASLEYFDMRQRKWKNIRFYKAEDNALNV